MHGKNIRRLVSSAIVICAGLGISSMFLPVASANDGQLIQDGAYELTPYGDVSDDNLMSHRSVDVGNGMSLVDVNRTQQENTSNGRTATSSSDVPRVIIRNVDGGITIDGDDGEYLTVSDDGDVMSSETVQTEYVDKSGIPQTGGLTQMIGVSLVIFVVSGVVVASVKGIRHANVDRVVLIGIGGCVIAIAVVASLLMIAPPSSMAAETGSLAASQDAQTATVWSVSATDDGQLTIGDGNGSYLGVVNGVVTVTSDTSADTEWAMLRDVTIHGGGGHLRCDMFDYSSDSSVDIGEYAIVDETTLMQTMIVASDDTLMPNPFEVDGYDFAGYSMMSDADVDDGPVVTDKPVDYVGGDSVDDLVGTGDGNLDLVAVWQDDDASSDGASGGDEGNINENDNVYDNGYGPDTNINDNAPDDGDIDADDDENGNRNENGNDADSDDGNGNVNDDNDNVNSGNENESDDDGNANTNSGDDTDDDANQNTNQNHNQGGSGTNQNRPSGNENANKPSNENSGSDTGNENANQNKPSGGGGSTNQNKPSSGENANQNKPSGGNENTNANHGSGNTNGNTNHNKPSSGNENTAENGNSNENHGGSGNDNQNGNDNDNSGTDAPQPPHQGGDKPNQNQNQNQNGNQGDDDDKPNQNQNANENQGGGGNVPGGGSQGGDDGDEDTKPGGDTSDDDDEKLNGIVEKDGKKYYYKNGVMQTGEQYIDSKWYHFDEQTGAMDINHWTWLEGDEHTPDGKWVYYGADGTMTYGEACIPCNNEPDAEYKWYWFDENTGACHHGWKTLEDGRIVYYDSIGGFMHHGWSTIDGIRYKFDDYTGDRLISIDENVIMCQAYGPWAEQPCGPTSNIRVSGCGAGAVAHAVSLINTPVDLSTPNNVNLSHWANDDVTPGDVVSAMSRKYPNNDYYLVGDGIKESAMRGICESDYGLHTGTIDRNRGSASVTDIQNALEQGKCVIISSVGPNGDIFSSGEVGEFWASGGHYICFYQYKDGVFWAKDSGTPGRGAACKYNWGMMERFLAASPSGTCFWVGK